MPRHIWPRLLGGLAALALLTGIAAPAHAEIVPAPPPPEAPPTGDLDNVCDPGIIDQIRGALSPIAEIQCGAARLGSEWFGLLGDVVVGTSSFRPLDTGLVEVYRWALWIGFALLSLGVIIAVSLRMKVVGGNPNDTAVGVFRNFITAIIATAWIPAILWFVEWRLINPATDALMGAAEAEIRDFISRLTAMLSSANFVGGALAAIIFGVVTGIGAIILFVLMVIRTIGLSILMVLLPIMLSGVVGRAGWESARNPIKYTLVLFMLKPVIALLILIGVKMDDSPVNENTIANIGSAITALGIILLSLFALPLLAKFVGAGDTAMLSAAAMSQEARWTPHTPGAVPSPSQLGNTLIQQRAMSALQGRPKGGGGNHSATAAEATPASGVASGAGGGAGGSAGAVVKAATVGGTVASAGAVGAVTAASAAARGVKNTIATNSAAVYAPPGAPSSPTTAPAPTPTAATAETRPPTELPITRTRLGRS